MFEPLKQRTKGGETPVAISMNYCMMARDPEPRDPILVYDYNRQPRRNFNVFYSKDAPRRAGLPDCVRQVMGVIYSIVYQPIESEDRSRSPEFLRIPAQQVNLIAGTESRATGKPVITPADQSPFARMAAPAAGCGVTESNRGSSASKSPCSVSTWTS